MSSHGENNLSLTYIYKDRLLYSIMFITSQINKNLNLEELFLEIENQLSLFFMSELRNQILENFKNYEERNFQYYKKCCDFKNTVNDLSLTNIYNQIDKLI